MNRIIALFYAMEPEDLEILPKEKVCKSKWRPYPLFESRINIINDLRIIVKYQNTTNDDHKNVWNSICSEIYECLRDMFKGDNFELCFVNEDGTDKTNDLIYTILTFNMVDERSSRNWYIATVSTESIRKELNELVTNEKEHDKLIIADKKKKNVETNDSNKIKRRGIRVQNI